MPNYAATIPILRGFQKLLLGAGTRLRSLFGLEAKGMLDRFAVRRALNKGGWDELMVQAGAMSGEGKLKIAAEDFPSFVLAMEKDAPHYVKPELQPVVQKLRATFDKVWKDISAAQGHSISNEWLMREGGALSKIRNVKPIGRLEGYWPHNLKQEYADPFRRDGDLAFKQAAIHSDHWNIWNPKAQKLEEADLGVLNEKVRQLMGSPAFDERTKASVNLLVNRWMKEEADQSNLYGKAIWALRDRAYGQLSNPFNVLKYSRQMRLMPEAYEDNIAAVLDSYGRVYAKHLAGLQVWGPKFENWQTMLAKLQATDPDEAKVFDMISSILQGTADYKYLTPGWRKFLKGATEFEVATKIGLGTAFLPNITQSLISTLPKAGVWRFLRGAAQAFTPEGQRLARQSGIQGRRFLALQVMAGVPDEMLHHKGLAKLLVENPGMKLFQWVNRLNNVIAVNVGEVYARDLWATARKAGFRSTWAKEQLARYGVDYAKPFEGQRFEAGFRFATETQLQQNALADPLWMNDPRLRWASLFKRFGLRQTAMVYDSIIASEVKHGNVLPLLRLIAGGLAGGVAVDWAKKAIERKLFNSPELFGDEDQTIFQQGLFFLAQGGALGLFGDFVGRGYGTEPDKIVESRIANLFFATTPVMLSEVTGIIGSESDRGWPFIAKKLAVDWVKEGHGKAVPDFTLAAEMKISPIGRIHATARKKRIRRRKETEKLIKGLYNE